MSVFYVDLAYRLKKRVGIPLAILALDPVPGTFGQMLDRVAEYCKYEARTSGKLLTNEQIWDIICQETYQSIAPDKPVIGLDSTVASVFGSI
jgi:hypothetical protein